MISLEELGVYIFDATMNPKISSRVLILLLYDVLLCLFYKKYIPAGMPCAVLYYFYLIKVINYIVI